MEQYNPQDRFPAGTLIYVGRRVLRHADEEDLKKNELFLKHNPAAFPHTFVDISNVELKDVAEQAAGKQGIVVDSQKVIRDKQKLAEVKAWRASMRVSMLNDEQRKLIGYTDEPDTRDEYEVWDEEDGVEFAHEHFVVLNFKTARSKLDVPRQPSDMLDEVREKMPPVYDKILAHLPYEEQLVVVVPIYNAAMAMKA